MYVHKNYTYCHSPAPDFEIFMYINIMRYFSVLVSNVFLLMFCKAIQLLTAPHPYTNIKYNQDTIIINSNGREVIIPIQTYKILHQYLSQAQNVFFIGIIEKLDHFVDIGIGGVWLSPIFKSPMKDFGYDVSDFREIDPLFGTMADFETLAQGCKDRGNLYVNIF